MGDGREFRGGEGVGFERCGGGALFRLKGRRATIYTRALGLKVIMMV